MKTAEPSRTQWDGDEPYSREARSVSVCELPSGFSYAFDYEHPNDVVLLSPRGAARLKELMAGSPPVDDELDRALAKAMGVRSGPTASSGRTLSVWLHFIDACNFSCFYCYVPGLEKDADPAAIDARTMQTSDFRLVLSRLIQFARATGYRELHLKVAGGEPTLNLPRLVEFLNIAAGQASSDLNITFGMISNGSFSAEELLPILERFDVGLSLSIDGVGPSHDRIRYERQDGAKLGTWRAVSDNARRLADAGRPPYLLYTVTPANYADIHSFGDFARSHGLGYRLSLLRSSRGPSPEWQDRILEELVALYRRLAQVQPTAMPIARFARFAEWSLAKRKELACSTCRDYFAVDARGRAASCQMAFDRPLGSLVEAPFEEITAAALSRPDTRMLGNPSSRTGACTRCTYFHVCAGGCPQHTLRARGSTDVPSVWCRVYGALVPVYVEAIASQMDRRRQELAGR